MTFFSLRKNEKERKRERRKNKERKRKRKTMKEEQQESELELSPQIFPPHDMGKSRGSIRIFSVVKKEHFGPG